MTPELSVALRQMSKLKKDNPLMGYYFAISKVMDYLISQGYSYHYAQDIAMQAWDLVYI